MMIDLSAYTKYLQDIHDYGASDKKLILHVAIACKFNDSYMEETNSCMIKTIVLAK